MHSIAKAEKYATTLETTKSDALLAKEGIKKM
jgi:hypothetical protein